MLTIYHIAEPDRWDPDGETYEAASLASEGFIHCSTRTQLPDVAEAFYRGRSDLILLSIDAEAVSQMLVWEDLYGAGEDFPHVYGPIPSSAVVGAEEYSV